MTKRAQALRLNKHLTGGQRHVIVSYRLDGISSAGRIIRARSRTLGTGEIVLEGLLLSLDRWALIEKVLEPAP